MSQSQHMLALAKGNDVRMKRAAIKRELRGMENREDARRRCGEILLDVPPEIDSMMVLDLLAACRRTGAVLAERILSRLRISPTRGVGDLTDRQRVQLAAELGAIADTDDRVAAVLRCAAPRRSRAVPVPDPQPERNWCPTCSEATSLTDSGICQWCGTRLKVAA